MVRPPGFLKRFSCTQNGSELSLPMEILPGRVRDGPAPVLRPEHRDVRPADRTGNGKMEENGKGKGKENESKNQNREENGNGNKNENGNGNRNGNGNGNRNRGSGPHGRRPCTMKSALLPSQKAIIAMSRAQYFAHLSSSADTNGRRHVSSSSGTGHANGDTAASEISNDPRPAPTRADRLSVGVCIFRLHGKTLEPAVLLLRCSPQWRRQRQRQQTAFALSDGEGLQGKEEGEEGDWELPGGLVGEDDFSISTAIDRLVREKTGLKVTKIMGMLSEVRWEEELKVLLWDDDSDGDDDITDRLEDGGGYMSVSATHDGSGDATDSGGNWVHAQVGSRIASGVVDADWTTTARGIAPTASGSVHSGGNVEGGGSGGGDDNASHSSSDGGILSPFSSHELEILGVRPPADDSSSFRTMSLTRRRLDIGSVYTVQSLRDLEDSPPGDYENGNSNDNNNNNSYDHTPGNNVNNSYDYKSESSNYGRNHEFNNNNNNNKPGDNNHNSYDHTPGNNVNNSYDYKSESSNYGRNHESNNNNNNNNTGDNNHNHGDNNKHESGCGYYGDVSGNSDDTDAYTTTTSDDHDPSLEPAPLSLPARGTALRRLQTASSTTLPVSLTSPTGTSCGGGGGGSNNINNNNNSNTRRNAQMIPYKMVRRGYAQLNFTVLVDEGEGEEEEKKERGGGGGGGGGRGGDEDDTPLPRFLLRRVRGGGGSGGGGGGGGRERGVVYEHDALEWATRARAREMRMREGLRRVLFEGLAWMESLEGGFF